jgi:hypothetical protein
VACWFQITRTLAFHFREQTECCGTFKVLHALKFDLIRTTHASMFAHAGLGARTDDRANRRMKASPATKGLCATPLFNIKNCTGPLIPSSTDLWKIQSVTHVAQWQCHMGDVLPDLHQGELLRFDSGRCSSQSSQPHSTTFLLLILTCAIIESWNTLCEKSIDFAPTSAVKYGTFPKRQIE